MSQVIVRRPAGKELPADFIQLVLEKCPKAWGIAILADKKMEINHGTGLDLETVQNTIENFKDSDITFYFAENSTATNLGDICPFPVITNGDEEPLVAIFLDGNFPGSEKAGSSHPAHYHLGIELMNTLGDVYELLDKDLDKFMEKIKSPSFDKKMKMHSVSRGYITVVAQNGGAVTFAQGDTAGDIPGGCWASNTFGYGKKAEEPPKEEKPEKKSMFPSVGKSTVREKHVPPSNAVQATGADKPKATETAVKAPPVGQPNKEAVKEVKQQALTIENIKVTKVRLPGHLSRKNRRAWIKERIGYTPPTTDNPEQQYEVYTTPSGTTLTKKEVQKLFGLSATKLQPLDNPKPTGKTETTNIDVDKQVSNQPLPVLSPTARNRLHNFISDERIKKVISENAEMVTDPDRVQGHEGKIAQFREQMGMKDTHDFDCLPFPELQKIASASFHDICVLAHDWRRRALTAEHRLGKVEKKEPKAEKVEATATPEKEKKSMFPSIRKVA